MAKRKKQQEQDSQQAPAPASPAPLRLIVTETEERSLETAGWLHDAIAHLEAASGKLCLVEAGAAGAEILVAMTAIDDVESTIRRLRRAFDSACARAERARPEVTHA